MYYLIARYYHPEHGVFLSLDPDPGDDDDILTQNGYTYANNNPVMTVDPDGHWVWFAVNAGFAAYEGYKAYKSGKGWKGVAWAVGSNFLKVGYIKKAGKVLKAVNKGTKKSRNKPKQSGTPYTTEFVRDKNGRITKYTTFGKNGEFVKEVRVTGKEHGNIPRPNVKEPNYNVNPKTGQKFLNGYRVRKARPNEIPKR